MEKYKNFVGTVVMVVVMFAIHCGWSMYRQHQLQQRIEWQMRLKQQAKPTGGVVMDQDGTIRWQDQSVQGSGH